VGSVLEKLPKLTTNVTLTLTWSVYQAYNPDEAADG